MAQKKNINNSYSNPSSLKKASVCFLFIFLVQSFIPLPSQNILGIKDAHAVTAKGLVGFWKFDEGSGINTVDSSGNSNTGIVTNAFWTLGYRDGTLDFDGADDYVTIGDIALLEFTNGSFSVSAWVYMDTYGENDQGRICGNDNGSGDGWDFQVRNTGAGNANLIQLNVPNATMNAQSDENVITTGAWYHIAFSRTASATSFYVNGIDAGINDDAAGSPSAGDGQFYIAKAAWSAARDFDGMIDEVRVYNRALTAEEVYEIFTNTQTKINCSYATDLTSGLVMMQSFDGQYMDWSNASAEARDATTNANHGDVSGATEKRGAIGQALEFDGVDDYVEISNNVNTYLSMTNGSLSLWFKANGVEMSDRLFSFANSGDYLYFYFANTDALRLIHRSDYGTIFDVTNSIVDCASDTDWHHAVATWDVNGGSETLSITFDGTKTTDSDVIVTPAAYSGNANIGCDEDANNNWFPGKIDEVRVYDRVLSADEITQLYQQGSIAAGKSACIVSASQTEMLTDGLVLMQSFDGQHMDWGSASSEAKDSTSNENHGDVDGAVAKRGKVGQALEFDGANDYVEISNDVNTYLNMTNGSISLWYKANGYTGNYLFHYDNGDGLMLYCPTATGITVSHRADFGGYNSHSTTIPNLTTNTDWHHVVATWDVNGGSETLTLTFDGARTTDSDAVATPAAYSATARIGCTSGGTSFFKGDIDEVRIYNRVLSATEAEQLYHMGGGR